MSKSLEQIQEHQFNQRLNILKGFKEVSGMAPLPIEELRKSLGDEPLYTVENLEKYTRDVLTKGNEGDIQKAKEVLNSLSCREVIDESGYIQNMYFYVEKGETNAGGRQGLVKKQITDKTGKNTTKWVRANKDDKGEDKTPKSEDEKPDVSSDKDSGQKESLANRQISSEEYASHASSTDSEDLKAFIQKNPDAPGAAEAKAELQKRGELDSEDEVGIDFNDPESVKNALAAHPDKEAIIDSAIENGITPAQALKLHESNKTDHSETHAAIDQAQAALDGLKDKTGHPDTQGGEDLDVSDFLDEHSEYSEWYEKYNGDYEKYSAGIREELNLNEGENEELEQFIENSKPYFDMVNQMDADSGKTTEDTKDLIDEHENLVDTLDSDSHDDDKQEADKQRGELKDLKDKQDHDGKDDDGDGKDEDETSSEDDTAKSEKDLDEAFKKIDDVLADDNFDIEQSQNSDSDYSKVLNYVSDLLDSQNISEETFDKVAKNWKGLDLVYSDFKKD